MTEWLREWLLGVVAAAMAVALIQSLTPKGTVGKIGRLAGGLLLLLAIVRPLLGAGLPELSLPRWQETDLETQIRENEQLFADLIEEQGRHDREGESIP